MTNPCLSRSAQRARCSSLDVRTQTRRPNPHSINPFAAQRAHRSFLAARGGRATRTAAATPMPISLTAFLRQADHLLEPVRPYCLMYAEFFQARSHERARARCHLGWFSCMPAMAEALPDTGAMGQIG